MAKAKPKFKVGDKVIVSFEARVIERIYDKRHWYTVKASEAFLRGHSFEDVEFDESEMVKL